MAEPTTAAMPLDLEVTDGYTLRLTALDPTTGAVVSGVNVSALVMQTRLVAGTSVEQLGYGPFMLVPGPKA